MTLYKAFFKQSNVLNIVLVKKNILKTPRVFWSKLRKLTWISASNLVFLLLSHLLYVICVKIFIWICYFKELHKDQEYNWLTTYRAGAALVSTITSKGHYLYVSFICRAKAVPSILNYFKTLSISPDPEIEPATFRSAVKPSTDGATGCSAETFELPFN